MHAKNNWNKTLAEISDQQRASYEVYPGVASASLLPPGLMISYVIFKEMSRRNSHAIKCRIYFPIASGIGVMTWGLNWTLNRLLKLAVSRRSSWYINDSNPVFWGDVERKLANESITSCSDFFKNMPSGHSDLTALPFCMLCCLVLLAVKFKTLKSISSRALKPILLISMIPAGILSGLMGAKTGYNRYEGGCHTLAAIFMGEFIQAPLASLLAISSIILLLNRFYPDNSSQPLLADRETSFTA